MSTQHFFVALPKQCILPSKKLFLVLQTFVKEPSYVKATFLCRFAKIVHTPSKKLLFVSKTFVKAPSYVNATFLCRVVKKNRLITMRPQPNYLTLVLIQLILLNFDQKIGLSKHYYMSTQHFFVALPKQVNYNEITTQLFDFGADPACST